MPSEPEANLKALSALAEATRRRAYEHVAASESPVSRDDVAEALGIGRTLAAYHLDRLAGDGLLEVSHARRSDRQGRGAGRPAKLYRRSAREINLSLPPRDYGLAAEILAQAASADADGGTLRALRDAAHALGREAGAAADDPRRLEDLLRSRGYEPYRDGPALRMRNCPFAAAARRHPEVICEMNLALLEGVVAGAAASGVEAVLDPGPGRCCVALHLGD